MSVETESFPVDVLDSSLGKNVSRKSKFAFIDLFAGIGGFHIAAGSLGGQCVFASEWDEDAREVYRTNFASHNKKLFSAHNFAGDINEVSASDVPSFDFAFAGFPCQPFSKGGFRRGFKDDRGNLFFKIAELIEHHQPPYVLLENVANLVGHDDGRTFKIIMKTLQELGYATHSEPLVLSPHEFGVPVLRPRIFIPAIRKDVLKGDMFTFDFTNEHKTSQDAYAVIDPHKRVEDAYRMTVYEKKVLDMWDEFYKNIDMTVIGFPVWADYFTYAGSGEEFPKWKKDFVLKNKALYERNKSFIRGWLKKHKNLKDIQTTHRKFEWQAGDAITSVYEGLIQFRPSGVRVKRPDKFSTLVAMNHAQIVGKYKRRLTLDEAKKLQSLPDDFVLHPNKSVALKQLGNGVNAEVVKIIVKKMLSGDYETS